MNILKLITSLLIAFALTSTVAQETEQVKRTKIVKKLSYIKDGTELPYKITIYKTTRTPIKLKKEDKGKINQDLADTSKKVSKLLLIDNDQFPDYDRYIVVKYEEDRSDSFELIPTDKGFKIVVKDRSMEYVFGDGIYFGNEEDKNFFMIDEFDVM